MSLSSLSCLPLPPPPPPTRAHPSLSAVTSKYEPINIEHHVLSTFKYDPSHPNIGAKLCHSIKSFIITCMLMIACSGMALLLG